MNNRGGTFRIFVAASVAAMVAGGLFVPVAHAAEAEPALSSAAWYWKTQQSQPVTDPTSGADVATLEAPSPFCPQAPGMGNPVGQGCEEGRLPIQVVNGDYKEPDKISAVAFDLALIPLGSKVHEFKATFVESDGNQSKPVNAEGKELRACPIEQFFGDGEGRQYKEVPRYSCSDSDPVAKRKAFKVKGEDRFAYTFDLTELAAAWVADIPPVTGVMLTPVSPKDFNGATDNNWRTVLAGPNENNMVQTRIRYTEAEMPGMPGLDDPLTTDPGGSFGGGDDFGGSGDISAGGDFGDAGAEDVGAAEGAGEGVPEEAEPDLALAGDESPTPTGSLPLYVWLALLAGLAGFSMVRSVVLESAAGIRPDGVLAQIREMNAARRGQEIAAAAAASSPLGGLISGVRGVGGNLASLVKKLPFIGGK